MAISAWKDDTYRPCPNRLKRTQIPLSAYNFTEKKNKKKKKNRKKKKKKKKSKKNPK